MCNLQEKKMPCINLNYCPDPSTSLPYPGRRPGLLVYQTSVCQNMDWLKNHDLRTTDRTAGAGEFHRCANDHAALLQMLTGALTGQFTSAAQHSSHRTADHPRGSCLTTHRPTAAAAGATLSDWARSWPPARHAINRVWPSITVITPSHTVSHSHLISYQPPAALCSSITPARLSH